IAEQLAERRFRLHVARLVLIEGDLAGADATGDRIGRRRQQLLAGEGDEGLDRCVENEEEGKAENGEFDRRRAVFPAKEPAEQAPPRRAALLVNPIRRHRDPPQWLSRKPMRRTLYISFVIYPAFAGNPVSGRRGRRISRRT